MRALDTLAFQKQHANMHNLSFPKTNEVRDRWRDAIVSYWEGLRRGESNNPCVNRGATALRDAYPEMTQTEAVQQTILAVAWVTNTEHSNWFWSAVPKREWIWPGDHRGVGHHRNLGYENV